MAVVPGWLDRLDANPPPTGFLDARIDCLRAATIAMGRAARQHTTALALNDVTPSRPHEDGERPEHHQDAVRAIDVDLGQRMAV